MKMLKGALALLFVAGAAGGAFAFARTSPPRSGAEVGKVGTETREQPPTPTLPPLRGGRETAEATAPVESKVDVSREGILELRKAAKKGAASDMKKAADKLEQIALGNCVLADDMRLKGDERAERAAMSRAFFATLDAPARGKMRTRLDELSQHLFFQTRNPDDIYAVKQGDVGVKIARAHKVAWSYVKRLNGLKNDAIRIGQKLRIPKGTLELTVFKADFLLILTLDGVYVKAWDVGTGREDRTPEAVFTIHERVSEPTWYAPDGKVYPFGEKENILGTRWLGFEKTVDYAGFGIHGTAFPETIGTESSAGCIRMRNEDVEEVYDLVAEGTQVTIVR